MIDTDKYEEHLKTVMDYMTDYFNGNWDEKFKPCPHCDEKEWPDSSCSCGYSRIPDILMHIQWSHDELFSPIHEMSSDLLAEVKRLRSTIDYIRNIGRMNRERKPSEPLLSIMEKVLTTEEYRKWRNKK